LNRVDRIGHGHMHHRHAARPGVNGDVRGLQDCQSRFDSSR
jgi:hypothetical protein